MNTDAIWTRIQQHAGEVFHQRSGGEFTYAAHDNHVVFIRTPRTGNHLERSVYRSQFEKALERVPFPDTTVLQDLQAPSYLYGTLMDTRIRDNDW